MHKSQVMKPCMLNKPFETSTEYITPMFSNRPIFQLLLITPLSLVHMKRDPQGDTTNTAEVLLY